MLTAHTTHLYKINYCNSNVFLIIIGLINIIWCVFFFFDTICSSQAQFFALKNKK